MKKKSGVKWKSVWMQALMESVLAEVPEKDRHYVMKS